MAYIGRDISNLSDRVVLDNITASATATYNLLLNSVAFVPSSAESLTVSLNGVIQKPQSSYTVSGSTIVFDSALTSSDSIDFILAERAITLTTIGSGTVNTSNIVDDAVTYAKTDGSFGKIGQIVSVQNTTAQSTTSTSFVDTGMSLAITPTSTSSKILCQISAGLGNTSSSTDTVIKVLRDSTEVIQCARISFNTGGHGNAQQFFQVLDSPSSTSSITYKLQMKADGGTTRFNDSAANGNPSSSIVLMEVLA